MRIIIHDLKENEIRYLKVNTEDKIINAVDCKNNCIGCFNCWIKHPKRCAINDNYSNIVDYLKESDELVLISKSRYGCYSSEVKQVLERIIGYVLPYFCIRNNEIHHKSRYDKKIKLIVYFYGYIQEKDKKCITNLVKANVINLNSDSYKIEYLKDIKELECIH